MTDFPDNFDREEHMVSGKKYPIKVVNLTPILTESEQLKQTQNIETQLAEIYSRYMGGGNPV